MGIRRGTLYKFSAARRTALSRAQKISATKRHMKYRAPTPVGKQKHLDNQIRHQMLHGRDYGSTWDRNQKVKSLRRRKKASGAAAYKRRKHPYLHPVRKIKNRIKRYW